MSGGWSNGFCDVCSSGPGTCLAAWCCGPCFSAYNSDAANNDILITVLSCLFYPFIVPVVRNRVREDKNIEGSVLGDIALGICCPCCTDIQTHSEL